jgi:hypothetical protein
LIQVVQFASRVCSSGKLDSAASDANPGILVTIESKTGGVDCKKWHKPESQVTLVRARENVSQTAPMHN